MDQSETFTIEGIPALLCGKASEKCILFLHGKLGCKEEAEAFARVANPLGWQVLGVDLPEHGARKEEHDRFYPWCVVPELTAVQTYMRSRWKTLALRANSIGAWFALQAFTGTEFDRALFCSPVLDMGKLIGDMMQWAGISPERLRKEQVIETDFGETLRWQYYAYAQSHSVTHWDCETHVLYAGHDTLTDHTTVTDFCKRFTAELTVMEEGEHWFHTKEQLAVLSEWERRCLHDADAC